MFSNILFFLCPYVSGYSKAVFCTSCYDPKLNLSSQIVCYILCWCNHTRAVAEYADVWFAAINIRECSFWLLIISLLDWFLELIYAFFNFINYLVKSLFEAISFNYMGGDSNMHWCICGMIGMEYSIHWTIQCMEFRTLNFISVWYLIGEKFRN